MIINHQRVICEYTHTHIKHMRVHTCTQTHMRAHTYVPTCTHIHTYIHRERETEGQRHRQEGGYVHLRRASEREES